MIVSVLSGLLVWRRRFEMATLRQLREKAVLTQAELARLADVTPSTVSDLEANKRKARPSTVRRLAKALRVKPSAIEFDSAR